VQEPYRIATGITYRAERSKAPRHYPCHAERNPCHAEAPPPCHGEAHPPCHAEAPPPCHAERSEASGQAAKKPIDYEPPPRINTRILRCAQNDNPPRWHAKHPLVMLSAAKHLAELQTNQSTMLPTNQSTMNHPPASIPRFFARAQNDNPPPCHGEAHPPCHSERNPCHGEAPPPCHAKRNPCHAEAPPPCHAKASEASGRAANKPIDYEPPSRINTQILRSRSE